MIEVPSNLSVQLTGMEQPVDFNTLKARQRLERETHQPNLALRVHRALSWLNKSEQTEDDDGRFIFLWIAFNAAYATEIDENSRLSEQETFKAFLGKLCDLDTKGRIQGNPPIFNTRQK